MGILQQFNNAVFNHPALADYESACAVIAQHADSDKAASIADEFERLAVYLRQASNEQLRADDAKIRARAEREAGKLLLMLKEQGVLVAKGRPAKNNGIGAIPLSAPSENNGIGAIPLSAPFALDDLGIGKRLATRLRAYAKLSENEFEEEAAQMEQQGKAVLPCAAEKPRKKAPIIEYKKEDVAADVADTKAALSQADETFQSLYEQEAAESIEKSEKIAALEEKLAKVLAENDALRAGAADAVNSEIAQKMAALEAENTTLKRDYKVLEVRFHQVQSDLANRQKSLNWYKDEYKKLCKATGYERPKKVSTYCTGTGYSDPNDPRAKPLPPMEGTPEKDLAQQLAQEKNAVNAQKKEANQWLASNHLPADDGYQFNAKQAAAQATRERFADKRPKSEPVKDALPISEEAKKREKEGRFDMENYKHQLRLGACEAYALEYNTIQAGEEPRGKIDWAAMGRNHGNPEAQQRILSAAEQYNYYNPPPGEAINGWGDLAELVAKNNGAAK